MILAAAMAGALFAQAFSGSWSCVSNGYAVPWSIAPAPGNAWTTVRWGNQQTAGGGIAYVAYEPALGKWLYRDFHYDGSYADLTGTQSGEQWRWTGPYYRDGEILNGDIVWTLQSANRIERTFRRLAGGKLIPSGSDYCVRTAATPSPR